MKMIERRYCFSVAVLVSTDGWVSFVWPVSFSLKDVSLTLFPGRAAYSSELKGFDGIVLRRCECLNGKLIKAT